MFGVGLAFFQPPAEGFDEMADDQVFEVRVRESWMGLDEFVGHHWVDIVFQLFSQLPDKIIVFREQETGHMVLIFLEMLKDMGQIVLW